MARNKSEKELAQAHAGVKGVMPRNRSELEPVFIRAWHNTCFIYQLWAIGSRFILVTKGDGRTWVSLANPDGLNIGLGIPLPRHISHEDAVAQWVMNDTLLRGCNAPPD